MSPSCLAKATATGESERSLVCGVPVRMIPSQTNCDCSWARVSERMRTSSSNV